MTTLHESYSPRPRASSLLPAVLTLVFFTIISLGALADPGVTGNSAGLDSIPSYRLGEVIIVRGSVPTNDVSQTHLGSAEIKAAGSTNMASALSAVPGLVVTSGSKGESRLQLRGFQSQETSVLFDGRPVNLPYYGDLDLSTLPLTNISRIRVLKGPVPSAYGANTMGGVVNVISQRVTGAPFREVSLAAGPDNTYQGTVNYGAARGQLDYWLSLGHSTSDGYQLSSDYEAQPLEDGDLRYNSDYRHTSVDGKVNYSLRGGTLLSLGAGVYDAERGLPTGTDRAQFQEFPLWRRWYIDAGGDGQWGNILVWRAKLYYDDCENRLKRFNDSLMVDSNLVFDSYHDSYDYGGNVSGNWKITEKVMNTTGVITRVDAISKQDDIGEPWLDGDILTLSGFSQFSYSPRPDIRTEAGVSVNRMTADAVDARETSVDPYASIKYSPIRQLVLSAAFARATRFPTLSHLFATVSGNPDLKPEYAVKIDFGYTVDLSDQLSWTQTYFNSSVDDLIDRRSKNDPYENIEKVELSGLESGVTVSHWNRLSITLTHMYLHALESRQNDGITEEDRRPYSPRHKVDYRVSYTAEFGLEAVHTGQYISDRVASDQTSLPDYYVANLRVAQNVRQGLKIFGSMRNILDKQYEEEKYYPMPGRTYLFGIEAQF